MTALLRSTLAILCTASLTFCLTACGQDSSGDIDALLTAYHDVEQFSGVVLVGEGDEIIYQGAFGEADRVSGTANTVDTRFAIGSVTKQMTAALILQLVEEGEVDLDAPITRYLPEYPAAQGDQVTIHQLLSHTSGIPEHINRDGFREGMSEPVQTDAIVSLFSSDPLDFEPGTDYAYSNSGYYVLGVIAERVTGMRLAQAMQQRLFDPLALTHTGTNDGAQPGAGDARGYLRSDAGFVEASYAHPTVLYSAGMISSTASDMLQWTRALHAAQPFQSSATLERMTTSVSNDYGYGIGVSSLPMGDTAVRSVGHSGGVPGFSSFVVYFPDDQRTVAVLSNTQGSVGPIALDVARILYGVEVDPPGQSVGALLDTIIESEGIDAAETRYRTLLADGGGSYDMGEGQLNDLGYAYVERGELETAIRLFRLNVEAFPDVWNPYDSLAEAYAMAGQRDSSIANYRRALALNPTAPSALEALERLGADPDVETVVIPDALLDAYVGSYAIQPGLEVAVTREGDALFAQPSGRPKLELTPVSTSRFYAEQVDMYVVFESAEGAPAQSLVLSGGGGPEMRGERVE